MAARRLLIVLVLLLAASIGAAALAPDRRTLVSSESSTSTTTTTTTTAAAPAGEIVTTRIDASPKDPETVRAAPGDQLALSVGVPAEPGRTIAIDEFGMTEFAAPNAPADFDLLLTDAGRFAITDEQGDIVGRIVVEAGKSEPAPGGDT